MLKKGLKVIKGFSAAQKGIVVLSGGAVIQAVLQLTVISILSRMLMAKDFGVIAMLQSLTTFSLMLAQFGASQVIIQRKEIDDKIIRNATFISICFGLAISILFFLSSGLIASFFRNKDIELVLKVFSPYFVLRSLSLTMEAQLSRELKFRQLTSTQIVSYSFGYGLVSIIFAALGFGYWSLVIGLYAGMIFSRIQYSLYCTFKMTFRPDKKLCKELLFEGGGFTTASFMNYFTEEVDNFIVGRKLGTVALGIYSRAFQLYSITSRFFGLIFDRVYFPILSQKQDDNRFLKKKYLQINKLAFVLLVPLSAILFFNARYFVHLFLGAKWDEVIVPFKILSVAIPFRFANKVCKSFAKSIGMVYKSSFIQFSFLVTLFALCMLLFKYGITGVAVAVTVSSMINYFLFSYVICNRIQLFQFAVIKVYFLAILLSAPIIFIYLNRIYFGRESSVVLDSVTFLFSVIVTAVIFWIKFPSLKKMLNNIYKMAFN